MGLTIHFTLRLPATFSQDEATAAMAALRQRCRALPMQALTRVVTLDASQIRHAVAERSRSPWRWAVIQHAHSVHYTYDHRGIPRKLAPGAQASCAIHARVQPLTLIGFSCQPGDGCEPINAFIGSYPASILAACRGDQHGYRSGSRRLMLDVPLRWVGSAFTKTQYASIPENGGITNFLRSHLLVIALLDAARSAGFDVEVHDEGGYWINRNIPALVAEIGSWNTFILGVGRQLTAAFGDAVQTAIDPAVMAQPVSTTTATAMGDAVLDLIRLTRGSCTPMPAHAPVEPATSLP